MIDLSAAAALIKEFEGLKDGDLSTPNLDPYLCPTGFWTIGWGHVVANAKGVMLKGLGKKAEARSIYPNGITIQEAEALLADDLRRFSAGVAGLVDVDLSSNQFNSLVSFAFNVGIGAFAASTLLKVINRKEFYLVTSEMRRWNKGTVNGKRQVLAGLTRRREAEAQLWQRP